MSKSLGEYIDIFGKFFSRIKNIGFALLIIILIVSFVSNGFQKKYATELLERVTGLDIEKDLLIGQKDDLRSERDSLQNEIYIVKEERDAALDLKEQAEWRSARDKREKNEALRALKFVVSDDSYLFLDNEAYPFTGEKEYGFNAKQVSGIHETFIENEFNKDIIQDQIAEIDYCNDALASTMEMETMGDEMMKIVEEEMAIDSTVLSIEEEKNEILMDNWKKNRRKDRWKKVEKWVFAVGGFLLGGLITK